MQRTESVGDRVRPAVDYVGVYSIGAEVRSVEETLADCLVALQLCRGSRCSIREGNKGSDWLMI